MKFKNVCLLLLVCVASLVAQSPKLDASWYQPPGVESADIQRAFDWLSGNGAPVATLRVEHAQFPGTNGYDVFLADFVCDGKVITHDAVMLTRWPDITLIDLEKICRFGSFGMVRKPYPVKPVPETTVITVKPAPPADPLGEFIGGNCYAPAPGDTLPANSEFKRGSQSFVKQAIKTPFGSQMKWCKKKK